MEFDNRKDEGLKSLGAKTTYRMDYAPEVLETFENKHPDNDYWVRMLPLNGSLFLPITLPSLT